MLKVVTTVRNTEQILPYDSDYNFWGMWWSSLTAVGAEALLNLLFHTFPLLL